jgi:hypothetical protein
MRGHPRSPLFGLTRLYQYPVLDHTDPVYDLSTLGVFFIGPFFKTETIRSGTPVSMSKLTKMDKEI